MTSLLLAALVFSAAPMYEAEIIFPHDTVHDHGSSIVETPSGDLLACWFHGSGERSADDVMVLGARKRKGADAWSDPFVMADTPNLPDCNPVLFMDPRGTLWLFWVAIQNNMWGGALLKYRTSTDYDGDGPPLWDWQDVVHTRPLNFEERYLDFLAKGEVKYAEVLEADPRYKEMIAQLREKAKDKLTRRLGWMTRIQPIMLDDDTIMLGLYTDVFSVSLAAFTSDWGETWTCSEPIVEFGNIQPAFIKQKDGGVTAYMRDNGIPKKVWTAESNDGGMTWSEVTSTEIPNPGSSVAAVGLPGGAWLLVGNDLPRGRHNLTAYLSDDEGKTWSVRKPLEELTPEDDAAHYPSLWVGKDGTIHLVYTFKEKVNGGSCIKHAQFNEAWLRAE